MFPGSGPNLAFSLDNAREEFNRYNFPRVSAIEMPVLLPTYV
jgi:hypothetical protein